MTKVEAHSYDREETLQQLKFISLYLSKLPVFHAKVFTLVLRDIKKNTQKKNKTNKQTKPSKTRRVINTSYIPVL